MSAAISTGYVNNPASAARPLGLFVLVRMAALEQAHRSAGHQQPAQLAYFRYVGLHEQHGSIGIQAQGEQIDRGVERQAAQLGGLADSRQGVQIGDEVVSGRLRAANRCTVGWRRNSCPSESGRSVECRRERAWEEGARNQGLGARNEEGCVGIGRESLNYGWIFGARVFG